MAGQFLSEQESALVIQALSLVRYADDFTPEEQATLKRVVERIAKAHPPGTSHGTKKSD